MLRWSSIKQHFFSLDSCFVVVDLYFVLFHRQKVCLLTCVKPVWNLLCLSFGPKVAYSYSASIFTHYLLVWVLTKCCFKCYMRIIFYCVIMLLLMIFTCVNVASFWIACAKIFTRNNYEPVTIMDSSQSLQKYVFFR